MHLGINTHADQPELSATRTRHPADDEYAVQVFLTDRYTAMYLTVEEARTLGSRLLAAAAAPAAELEGEES